MGQKKDRQGLTPEEQAQYRHLQQALSITAGK
jgi:hypothetical protein